MTRRAVFGLLAAPVVQKLLPAAQPEAYDILGWPNPMKRTGVITLTHIDWETKTVYFGITKATGESWTEAHKLQAAQVGSWEVDLLHEGMEFAVYKPGGSYGVIENLQEPKMHLPPE